MRNLANLINVLSIITAVLGGLLSVLAAVANLKKLFSPKRISLTYYISYGLVGISMFLWAIKGLLR